MTNKSKRLLTGYILWGLSLAIVLFITTDVFRTFNISSYRARDILALTFAFAQAGLGYRAFETRKDFDTPPWIAYFFSYQLRLVIATIFISTVSYLVIWKMQAPIYLALGVSGPLAFLFGREPKLHDLLKILDKAP